MAIAPVIYSRCKNLATEAAMNWYSQLTQLILDFYREDPQELQQLKTLRACKVSRWWGVLRVNCGNQETADAMVAAGTLIKEPVAQLRLAQKIKILVNGTLVKTLPVNSSSIIL